MTSATTAVALVWSAEQVPAPTDDADGADANATLLLGSWDERYWTGPADSIIGAQNPVHSGPE